MTDFLGRPKAFRFLYYVKLKSDNLKIRILLVILLLNNSKLYPLNLIGPIRMKYNSDCVTQIKFEG